MGNVYLNTCSCGRACMLAMISMSHRHSLIATCAMDDIESA